MDQGTEKMRFIDRLRELLLPAMALTILVTLWMIAKARAAEEDLARGFPPASSEVMTKVAQASMEDDAPKGAVENTVENTQAKADTMLAGAQH